LFIYVDNRSAKVVQGALNQVSKNRTTIVVAHRLTSIRDADLIMVFNNGNVVECGTHFQLMQIENGIYCALTAQTDLEKEEEEEEEEEEDEQVNIHKDISTERQLSNDSACKF
jgi:ATP-binding cassette subfamily B (MDR/TAP) protein 1